MLFVVCAATTYCYRMLKQTAWYDAASNGERYTESQRSAFRGHLAYLGHFRLYLVAVQREQNSFGPLMKCDS